MPTYEFRCPQGHEFEKFYRSINAAPREVSCPTCGSIAERLLSGAGLVFKGSGFYITDYGKDGKKPQTPPPAAGSAAGSESSASKSDAGGDSKPSGEQTKVGESKPASSDSAAPKPATSKPSGRAKSGE
jgi:putative FmdB family regulatory protein